MAGQFTCPNCRASDTEQFHTARNVPTNSCILLTSREEAKAYPRGHIELRFCRDCGFISNALFDAKLTEYSERYEETQGFSPTFNTFHRELAERLINKHDLRGKRVMEIGCGKGEFLLMLCQLGDNHGIGFDPSYRPERTPEAAAVEVEFVRDFYSEKYRDTSADFVACKMTLEHIHPTADFIGMVRRAIGDRPDTVVFFQIPDVMRILRDCAFEDIYYEHCSYFGPLSLAHLFRSCGFTIQQIDTEYGDQYLTIEARPGSGDTGDDRQSAADTAARGELNELVQSFPTRFQEKLDFWRRRLDSARASGQRVVLWGSGSKAVSFLSSLDLGDEVAAAVDINPHRHGYFMPGSGHEILAPEVLPGRPPDLVIVMNAIYRDEIAADLAKLGLRPEIVCV
ncbi:MAG: class I SAM-dependent methyltransferase [bacterium]